MTASPASVLISAQKDEGPFLLEWLAYHRVIGFERIIVASNDCTDGSDALLDALHAAGEVVHLTNRVGPDEIPQKKAAATILASGAVPPGAWTMWLDLDEYLLPPDTTGRLPALLAELGDQEALSIAWRFCGDSGNATWPGRQIWPSFPRAARRWRRKPPQVKTLFRFGDWIEAFDIHRPILRAGVGPDDFRWIGSDRQPVPAEFYHRDRRNPYNRLASVQNLYRLGQVLHFSIRTPDMFQRKRARGDGYFDAANQHAVVRDAQFYAKKNQNQAEERSAFPLIPDITAEMRRLAALPGVADCLSRIDGFRWPDAPATTPLSTTEPSHG
ncbi:glycosyltransferase family 2 protein [Tabrizicola aquatica]|uniref:glycosyltransferase family 2 protein n=1 Tax=Tabrizicola aquatica TaxID=909926 RepID=UPI000CD05866|nr:glycosyltransferase family 2 protein [Tabrizicola aquatica]